MSDSRDRELGMHRKITRRVFINGMAVTALPANRHCDLRRRGANADTDEVINPPWQVVGEITNRA